MTGLTLPANLNAALPGKIAAPSLLAPGAPANGAAGVPNLAAFLDLMIGKAGVTAKQGQPGEERQDDAATGKALPDQPDEKGDAVLAWLMAVAPIVFPPAAPAKPVVATGGGSPLAGAPGAPGAVAPALPAAAGVPQPLSSPDAPQLPVAPAGPPTIAAGAPPAAPADAAPLIIAAATEASAVTAQPNGQAKIALDRPAAAPPTAQPIHLAVPAAAPAMIAASGSPAPAMPALFALAMAPGHDADRGGDKTTPGGIATAASLLSPADATSLIAKPGEAQRQALDMGRQDWPQKMIDRIEALRDDANANDTSIRLKPEALGRIDVSLRTHADGAVSVRFAAEQPATRTLLADAAPQLNAAAEARGIRLTGTSVDLTGSGMTGGDRPPPRAERRQDSSNRLATGGEDEIRAVDDGRVA